MGSGFNGADPVGRLGLTPRVEERIGGGVGGTGTSPTVGPGPDGQRFVLRAAEVLKMSKALLAIEPAAEAEATKAIDAMREQIVQRQLASIPVARLKETTQGRLRIPTLEAAGYRTLASVLAAGPYQLQTVPRVGEKTAAQIVAAARQLSHTLGANARIRFDADGRPPADLAALQAIRSVELSRANVVPLLRGRPAAGRPPSGGQGHPHVGQPGPPGGQITPSPAPT